MQEKFLYFPIPLKCI